MYYAKLCAVMILTLIWLFEVPLDIPEKTSSLMKMIWYQKQQNILNISWKSKYIICTKCFIATKLFLWKWVYVLGDFIVVFLVLDKNLHDFTMQICLCCSTSLTICFLFMILVFLLWLLVSKLSTRFHLRSSIFLLLIFGTWIAHDF